MVIVALFLGVALVVGGERYRNIRAVMQELQGTLPDGGRLDHAPLALRHRRPARCSWWRRRDGRLLGSLAQFIAVVIGSTLFHGVVVLP